MSSQKAISGNTQKNNGATILQAGNYTSGAVTNKVTLRANAIEDGYGSKVIEKASQGTFNAATTFGRKMSAGDYIMKRVTTTVNGVANTFLRSGAADAGAKRYPTPINYTRLLDEDSWDYVTGAVTKGGNEGNQSNFVNPATGGTAADVAAHGTNAVPGELVYRTGAKLPVQDDYAPRTAN